MKKILFTFLLTLSVASASAQLIQSSALITTKRKLPEIKAGYEQSIDLSYGTLMSYPHSYISATYIGGYRFDHRFFLGAGAGVNLAIARNSESIGKETTETSNLLNIPLYAHFRTYFLNRRCTPFIGISLGALLSTPRYATLALGKAKYGTCGLLLNPQVGVNYRMNEKSSIYFAVGFAGHTFPKFSDITAYNMMYAPKFHYGVDAHLGFTF